MTHEEKVSRWLSEARAGVEIGAFKTPIPGLNPFYVDCFEEYAGERCLIDYKGDACNLPFIDNALDYVATSHVLEHVANPLQALYEWGRVLKPRGTVYAVIPDKRLTWDRNRKTTTMDHFLSDFREKVGQCDGTHIDDFIDGIIWDEYAPDKNEEEREGYRNRLRAAIQAGLDINIHFHTFEPSSFPDIVHGFNSSGISPFSFEILDLTESFPASTPNGFLAVLRVLKNTARDRVESRVNIARFALSSELIIKPGFIRAAPAVPA